MSSKACQLEFNHASILISFNFILFSGRVREMIMKVNKHVNEHLLTILTITAVVGGVVVGLIARSAGLDEGEEHFNPRIVMYVNFIGDIFLRILKSLILPLIVASLVSAVGSLDISLSKKIGTRAIFYYLMTTVMAVVLGIVLVIVIRPGGDGLTKDQANEVKSQTRSVTTPDTILDLIR